MTSGNESRVSYGSAFTTVDGEYTWPQLVSAQRGKSTSGRPTLWTLVHRGDAQGETSLRINGARSDDGSAFPYHKTSPIPAYVGCAYRQRSPWKGDIAEIIIYAKALEPTEREVVERYLARKYHIVVAEAERKGD